MSIRTVKKENRHHDCTADPACHYVTCFQARITVANGKPCAGQIRELCAVHLGEVVIELRDWARGHGITDGQVTVLIVAPSSSGQALSGSGPDGRMPRHLLFGSIPVAS